MDEATWDADDWCEQARELTDQEAGGRGALLPRLLAHIDAGIRLRRPLDSRAPDSASEAHRRALARRLVELRLIVYGLLDDLEPGSPKRDVLVGRVRDWLGEARTTLRIISTDSMLGPLGRALAAEGLRGDLEWLSVLIARLDGEPPPRPTATLEVQLERIHHELSLSAEPQRPSDPELERLRGRCERLRWVLLERRVRRELSSSTTGAPPERLLAARLKLSRLQARVCSLEPVEDDEGNPRWLGGDPEEWSEALSIRRIELADRAATRLQEMDLSEARRPCERAAQTVQDEISEMIAFLEDMPLRRAVKRLELARDDLEQFILLLRREVIPPRSQGPGPDGSPAVTSAWDRETDLQEAEDESLVRERIGEHVRSPGSTSPSASGSRRGSWPTWTSSSRRCRPKRSTLRTRSRRGARGAGFPSRLWWTA